LTIVPKIPDPVMAGMGTERKEIMITREARLKNFLITDKVIQEEIERRMNKLVSSQEFYFSKKPNYKDILKILQDSLNNNNFRWVNLEFSFSYKFDQSADGSNIKIKFFLFGRSKFICENIREIVGRIVTGDEWRGKEARISSLTELSIEDLFRLFL